MSVLHKFLIQRPTFPHIGMPLSDLIAALEVLERATEVQEKRVTGLSPRENGRYLVVTPGQQLGGCMGGGQNILLEKVGEQWKVVEVSGWRS